MGRKATSLNDQLLLLKSRGMDIDVGDDKAKEILIDIGYYRLGFYWNPFEIDEDHNFQEGTKFSDVIALYYLDVDLRSIIARYLNRIEINFRTKIVYYVSNKYKDSPTWFIDSSVMSNQYVLDFHKYYDSDFIRNNKPIKRHHKKYLNDKYAPAWKTLEFFTFGAILKIYKSLKADDIKQRISKLYEIENVDKFINLISTIVHIRNVCAHGAVIFDFKTPRGISKIPNVDFNNNDRHSLDSSLKIVYYLLDQISSSRRGDMENKIVELFEKNSGNQLIKSIIEKEIGYRY